jgi:hypothetical protein
MLCLPQLRTGLQPVPPLRRGALLGLFAAALAAGCAEHCIVPAAAPPVAAARCGACHAPEAEAWRGSPHARAYVSDDFKEQTHDYAAADCLSCHAPIGPAAEGGRPAAAREAARAEGVTCVSCHALGAEARPGATAAALFAGGASLRAAAFCGRCHEDTFREWSALASEKRLDCAACHMRREAKEGGGFAADHSLGRGRETLSRYAVLAEILAARREAGEGRVAARVLLENFAADHALPTGGYGFRDLRLTVELVDRAGRPLAARALDLVVTGRGEARPLAARERRELAFELSDPDALGTAVRARLEKAGPAGPDPVPKAIAQQEVD